MSVPAVNLRIDKDTHFEATFDLTNADGTVFSLINYSADARLRKHPTASSYTTFSTTITAAQGKIKIELNDSQTGLLKAGRHVYDVLITDGSGTITKVFEGTAMVYDTVSSYS